MKTTIKYRLIKECNGKYSIIEMCVFFGIFRSGYYRYLKYIDKPDTDILLVQMIAEYRQNRGKISLHRSSHNWI